MILKTQMIKHGPFLLLLGADGGGGGGGGGLFVVHYGTCTRTCMHTPDHLPYSLQLFECSGNDPGDIRQPGVSRTEGTVAQDGLNMGENEHTL